MSTRCTIEFVGSARSVTESISVYRHHDGYVEGNGVDLVRFLKQIEETNSLSGPYQGRYFESVGQLAGWWVAHLLEGFSIYESKSAGVEICDHQHNDVDYRYQVYGVHKQKPEVAVYERYIENNQWQWRLFTDDLEAKLQRDSL